MHADVPHGWWNEKCSLAENRMLIASKPKLGQERASALPRGPMYPLFLRVGIVTALIGILYGAVLADMARDWWNEPALSQGMLLPPLAVYIAWISRRET